MIFTFNVDLTKDLKGVRKMLALFYRLIERDTT